MMMTWQTWHHPQGQPVQLSLLRILGFPSRLGATIFRWTDKHVLVRLAAAAGRPSLCLLRVSLVKAAILLVQVSYGTQPPHTR